ncbi:MAG: hypothetical protein RI885_1302 [Actinomycetota bacterium]|jgi:hypothetical protein
MADDRDTTIDPRFDPAFQRGFVGEVAIGSDDSTTRQALFLPPPVITVPPSGPSPVSKSTVAAPDFSHTTAGPDDALTELEAAFDDDHDDDRPIAEGRNPFVIALWILGPVFIGAGIAMYGTSISGIALRFGGIGADGDALREVVSSVMYWMATPMVAIGIATIIGLCFRRAVAETHS